MRHPRRALLIGAIFFVTGVVYWLVSYEPTGTAALCGLGIAMAVMSYALASAAPGLLDDEEPGAEAAASGHGSAATDGRAGSPSAAPGDHGLHG